MLLLFHHLVGIADRLCVACGAHLHLGEGTLPGSSSRSRWRRGSTISCCWRSVLHSVGYLMEANAVGSLIELLQVRWGGCAAASTSHGTSMCCFRHLGSKMADVAASDRVESPPPPSRQNPGSAVALLAASRDGETIPLHQLIILGFVANLSIGGCSSPGCCRQ